MVQKLEAPHEGRRRTSRMRTNQNARVRRLWLALELRIAHERWGSRSDPSLNGHLHYPNDLDGPLNETH